MLNSFKLPILKPITWAVVILILFFSCATPVAPSGGEKDEIPPLVVSYEPANYSTNFSSKRITITFNEFIQLEGVSQKLMVSPPMDDEPEIDTRGKSVVIDIADTLLPNTTYSFYFADAIVDLHESNPIQNFEYVFSTGPVLDSMQVSGRVVNARNYKPVADVFVMLYKEHTDSVPMKKTPFYLSKTASNGEFTLSNLAREKYKLFALQDKNSNYLFDLPNERIAFSDSLITPTEVSVKKLFNKLDTASADTTIVSDTLQLVNDTTARTAAMHADSLIMRMFRERDTVIKVTTAKLEGDKYLNFGFNLPVDSLEIEPIKPIWQTGWSIREWMEDRDSLLLWLKDFTSDSLVLDISANTLRDTLTFTNFKSDSKGTKNVSDPNKLVLKPDLKGNAQPLKEPLKIVFNHPVINTFTQDSLFLFSTTDTTTVGFRKTALREITINHTWKEAVSYKLLIPDSTATSIYGIGNDSTMVTFRTKSLKDYGNLKVNIITDSIHSDRQYVVTLLTKDEKTRLESFEVNTDTSLSMQLLDPGMYKMKGFIDRNKNGRWDSGLYLENEQPEKVFYYPGTLEIIGNWDVEYDWKIKP